MRDAVYTDQHVFDGGPPLRLQKSLGLVKPDQPRAVKRALFAACIAWIPLALLTAGQSLLSHDSSASWFFADFSVHSRYLIALPALILAESDCIPRLEKIVRHFVDIGLISSADMPRFQAAVDSSRRLLNSKYSDFAVPLVSYLIVIAVMLYIPADIVPPWHRDAANHRTTAGWWQIVVSLPLLMMLLFGWLWRLTLWGRFLVLVARLDLQLLPSHPDSVGGLRFVSTSLRGFRLISFALSAIVAGSIAERIVYHNSDVFSFKSYLIGVIVFILIVFAGPLTVFVRRIRETRRRGIFEYGALANRLGREFEAKWLRSNQDAKQEMLEVPDFSATTDYFSVAANVYEMRDFPFRARDLIGRIAPALIPFAAVALLQIPFQVVLDSVIKLLF